MSRVLSLLKQIPRDIACCVIAYDDRYSVRNDSIYEIGRIPPTDNRYTMLRWMFRERTLHIEWFKLMHGWNGNQPQPQLVIPITRQHQLVLCIYLAEYYSDFLGEPELKWVREVSSVTSLHDNKLICEY